MANLTENRRAYDRERYLRRRGRHVRSNRIREELDTVEREKWSPAPGWIWELLWRFWGLDVDRLQRYLVSVDKRRAPDAPKLGRPRGGGAKRKEGGSAPLEAAA